MSKHSRATPIEHSIQQVVVVIVLSGTDPRPSGLGLKTAVVLLAVLQFLT